MDDNAPPPAPDVQPAARNIPRPPPRETSQLGLVLVLVFGVLLGQFYLSYIVPSYSVLPTTYPQANFQNKSANYYDVLDISHDANAIEIELAYKTQLSNLSPTELSSSLSSFNFTAHAKIIEVERAFSILQGMSRCLYDFEFLGLGISRYCRCWWDTDKLDTQNWDR
ncbi:hypothetical protein F4782DRAFT_530448 [Xylaria castorea]|nr:hypothetical protein F4782DRAFT_530448 [Xylaria castorea]